MRIALLMVVSPGEEQLAADSLQHAIRAIPTGWAAPVVLLVNNTRTHPPGVPAPEGAQVIPLNLPHAPRPYFEIARTVGQGLAAIAADSRPFDLICKLDPDTVVVSPAFFTDLADSMATTPLAFVGWFTDYAAAVTLRLRLRLLADLLPLGLRRADGKHRYGGRLKLRLGPAWHWRATLRGRHARQQPSGGGYALSPGLLQRLAALGWLKPTGPNGLEWNDDTLLPIAARAAGGRVINLRDNPQRLAGWRWMHGSRYFNDIEALTPGLCALHPLKDNPADWQLRRQLAAGPRS